MSCNGRSEISPLHLIAYKCNYQQLRDIHELNASNENGVGLDEKIEP